MEREVGAERKLDGDMEKAFTIVRAIIIIIIIIMDTDIKETRLPGNLRLRIPVVAIIATIVVFLLCVCAYL